MKHYAMALTALAIGLGQPAAQAHGDADHAKRPVARQIDAEEHAFGRQGDPKKATRTIRINMADTMRFAPGTITVKQGETVRFVVSNGGKLLHEMVIGTEDALKKHAEMMQKHPGMEHDEPYMAHVKPGTKEDIVWTFTRPGSYMYGCLIPGHFEAGMKGTIKVVSR